MKRVLVNLNEQDLRLADSLAGRLRISRSEAFRRGLAKLAAAADQPGLSTEERDRRRLAGRDMDRLAKYFGALPDLDAATLIRADRDRRDARDRGR